MKDESVETMIKWKESNEVRPEYKTNKDDDELRILWLQWPRLKIVNGVLYREYREEDSIYLQFVVPKQMREKILLELHDSWCGGHLGNDKTIAKLDERYYWPRITKHVKRYIQSCSKCATSKTPKEYGRAPLRPMKATYPFELVTTDVQGPFPQSKKGNRHIITFHDCTLNGSKYSQFRISLPKQ